MYSIFYEFDDKESTEISEEQVLNRETSKFEILFDPIEVLFKKFDRHFLTLSSIDYFFNFTQTLGNNLFPQEIDNNFHAFNITSKTGYTDYIFFKRPTGFVYEYFSDNCLNYLPSEERNFRTYRLLENLQIFSKLESFTDIRRTGQYADLIILEKDFLQMFNRELLEKLSDMLRSQKHKDKISFFILDIDFDFRIFEFLSYLQILFEKSTSVYFLIPPAIPFYEKKYFLCFVSDPERKQDKSFHLFPNWLERMLKKRKVPNYNLFPYQFIIDWNILRKS